MGRVQRSGAASAGGATMSATLPFIPDLRILRPGVRSLLLVAMTALAAVPFRDSSAQETNATQPSASSLTSQQAGQIYVLPIRGEITNVTHDSLKRRLGMTEGTNLQIVVIELDTPGGALKATLEICHELKALRDDGVRVVAWVNHEAYSAGTIIALAADEIVMARNATIGDCQPIQITQEGASAIPDDIKAKAVSPLLAELEDSARRNNYEYETLLALIDPAVSLYWLRNTETGERRLVDTKGRDRLFGLERKESAGGGVSGLLKILGTNTEKDTKDSSGDVSDSRSRTAWKYVENDPSLGRISQPVDGPDQLLTMRTDKAKAFGFCRATVSNDAELREYLKVNWPVTRLESNWIESIIKWLASPLVRGILFLFMLLAIYTELNTPGVGIAGAVALICLILFLGAPYLTGYTVTWEIVAIVLGAILLLIEIFVIPGFGVAGVLGVILMAVGLLFSFAPSEPGFERELWPRIPTFGMIYVYLKHGLYALTGGLVGSLVGMYFIARYLPRVPVAGSLIAPNPDHEAVQLDDPYHGVALVGDTGTAETLLRPAGKARFGRMLVDVVSEGEYIESGAAVVVVERRGNRVVVRRAG